MEVENGFIRIGEAASVVLADVMLRRVIKGRASGGFRSAPAGSAAGGNAAGWRQEASEVIARPRARMARL